MRIPANWILILALTLFGVGCASTPAPEDPVPAAPPNSLKVGETNLVAISAPPAPAPAGPQMTLPEFLGLRGVGSALVEGGRRICSRLKINLGLVGRFPGLQPQPPIVPITDPSNLDEEASPAVQTAAKVKAEQDEAPQKIQALRYLATIGCGGCYPDIEEALLAALDDCVEEVRFEAVKALRGTRGKNCQYCRSSSCCSAKVQEKLRKLVTETDGCGCYVESSDRVRRQARLALQACGPPVVAPDDSAIPEEGPVGPTPADAEAFDVAARSQDGDAASKIRQVSFLSTNTNADMILGYVGTIPILSKEVERQLVLNGPENGPVGISEADEKQIRSAMQPVIDRHLLKMRYLHERSLESWDASLYDDYDRWLEEKLPSASDVLPTTIQRYYETHLEEFLAPAEVRWEKAAIRIGSEREAATAKQCLEYVQAIGNGATPPEPSGLRETTIETEIMPWTSPADVRHPELRKVLFSTETGQCGPILEINNRLVLVRVLQKTRPRQVSLNEATDEIRAELAQERRVEKQRQLVEEFRDQVAIWTVFDGPPPTGGGPATSTSKTSPRDASEAPQELSSPVSLQRGSTPAPFRNGALQPTREVAANPAASQVLTAGKNATPPAASVNQLEPSGQPAEEISKPTAPVTADLPAPGVATGVSVPHEPRIPADDRLSNSQPKRNRTPAPAELPPATAPPARGSSGDFQAGRTANSSSPTSSATVRKERESPAASTGFQPGQQGAITTAEQNPGLETFNSNRVQPKVTQSTQAAPVRKPSDFQPPRQTTAGDLGSLPVSSSQPPGISEFPGSISRSSGSSPPSQASTPEKESGELDSPGQDRSMSTNEAFAGKLSEVLGRPVETLPVAGETAVRSSPAGANPTKTQRFQQPETTRERDGNGNEFVFTHVGLPADEPHSLTVGETPRPPAASEPDGSVPPTDEELSAAGWNRPPAASNARFQEIRPMEIPAAESLQPETDPSGFESLPPQQPPQGRSESQPTFRGLPGIDETQPSRRTRSGSGASDSEVTFTELPAWDLAETTPSDAGTLRPSKQFLLAPLRDGNSDPSPSSASRSGSPTPDGKTPFRPR